MTKTTVDPRNKLNSLSGKEWLISTRSVWLSNDYDFDQSLPPHLRHLKKLINFFTKPDQNIYSHEEWKDLALICQNEHRILQTNIPEGDVDLIIWRAPQTPSFVNKGFEQLYDEKKQDFYKFHDILKDNGYFLIIVSNFHHPVTSSLLLHHLYVTYYVISIGFKLKGQTIWVPKEVNKPADRKEKDTEIVHNHILVFRKEATRQKSVNSVNSRIWKAEGATTIDYTSIPSYIVSKAPPRDSFKARHPATFSEDDVSYLIKSQTKRTPHPAVLDPFCGVGSALVACHRLDIPGWGIELTPKWISLAEKRFNKYNVYHRIITKSDELDPQILEAGTNSNILQHLIQGDVRKVLPSFPDNYFDFLITSPPYWKILTKKIDHKTRRERVQKGLETKYTTKDEDETFENDLANLSRYLDPHDLANPETFIGQLHRIFSICYSKLKAGAHACVIVSDFRDGPNFFFFHGDIAQILQDVGFKLTGLTILHQNNKNLYPYGYPYAFVSNIHHQNILLVKKD